MTNRAVSPGFRRVFQGLDLLPKAQDYVGIRREMAKSGPVLPSPDTSARTLLTIIVLRFRQFLSVTSVWATLNDVSYRLAQI